MALYGVFLPGYMNANGINPALITGFATNTISQPVTGMLVTNVNGGTAAAAGAAVQAAIPGGNQQGLMHVFLMSNDTTV